jgi:lipopolysaccharide/colanic/teichoic acid biosynthesis glycosyltransferase
MSTQPISTSQSEGAVHVDAGPQAFVTRRLLEPSIEPRYAWYLPWKAAFDCVAAVFLLALSAPLILLAGLLVKLTSRGPAIYRQTRLGRDGREFVLYKLRTMVENAETMTGPVWAEADDPRITPLGRFLRTAHIDELPQLVNVLMGHMSLVGPRPERPELVPQLEWELPRYRDRLLVRPGMTGVAQLRLPPDSDLESVRRKLVYDLYYVHVANPWLDARVLLFTGVRVFVHVLKAFWQLVALPRWEMVERDVPPLIDSEEDWDASACVGRHAARGSEPTTRAAGPPAERRKAK